MNNLVTFGTCSKEFSQNADSCIHCGEPNQVVETNKPLKWYNKTGIVILLLVLIPPVGIYGMWKGGLFPTWVRWLITISLVLGMFDRFQKTIEPATASPANPTTPQSVISLASNELDLCGLSEDLMTTSITKNYGTYINTGYVREDRVNTLIEEMSQHHCDCMDEELPDTFGQTDFDELVNAIESDSFEQAAEHPVQDAFFGCTFRTRLKFSPVTQKIFGHLDKLK